MTIDHFAGLLATMFAIAIVPGPSDLLVVGRSIASGFVHGAAVTTGIVAADYVLILAAMLSLGLVATELGWLFVVIRYGCGLFLIGFGWLIWRGRHVVVPVHGDSGPSLAASFAAGWLLTLGDPKAIVFYLGLLPAFVDLTAVTWRETALVMLAATVTIASIKLGYAFLSARAKSLLESSRARVVTSAIGAAASTLLGAALLLRG